MAESGLKITLGFGGGAELLVGKEKSRAVHLDDSKQWLIRDLLVWMRDNIITERPELFMQNDSVRPGILVLINDTDWELLGELNYKIQPKDEIVFISTLHGG